MNHVDSMTLSELVEFLAEWRRDRDLARPILVVPQYDSDVPYFDVFDGPEVG